MDEAARLITLLTLAGGALTLLGAACAWFLDEVRRIRRTLAQALGAEPQPWLAARGRGVGLGFNLATGRLAVTWDKGAWRLDYAVAELIGVELIVDRRVAARAFRGEPRRPLDQLDDPQERVRLRFVFDDPARPDFDVDLWRPEDDGRKGRLSAEAALHEANRWVARIEALLRRSPARPQPTPIAAATTPAPVARAAPTAPSAGPLFDDDAVAEDEIEDDPEGAIT
jgi:hypothetical protein